MKKTVKRNRKFENGNRRSRLVTERLNDRSQHWIEFVNFIFFCQPRSSPHANPLGFALFGPDGNLHANRFADSRRIFRPDIDFIQRLHSFISQWING